MTVKATSITPLVLTGPDAGVHASSLTPLVLTGPDAGVHASSLAVVVIIDTTPPLVNRFQQDWPNPLRPRYAIDLRTWVNPSNPNLPPSVPRFGVADPLPSRRPRVVLGYEQSSLLELLAGAIPFFGTADPNPILQRRVAVGFIQGLNLGAALIATPFYGSAQPQFFVRRRMVTDRIQPTNLPLFNPDDDMIISLIW